MKTEYVINYKNEFEFKKRERNVKKYIRKVYKELDKFRINCLNSIIINEQQ